ncbi:MAG: 2TM domain-containing protein [Polaribacter sp.]|uniref:2TM domain-containing protein n=1 Tax=Polaribacter sp. TaxID=1920175 RepID=UPI002F354684
MQNINHSINLKVKKRIKDLKGFYTHLFSTFLIIPFIIFINLKTVPQFHWFWYAIIAWCIGLFIHWLNVFGFSKNNFKNTWEERKMKESIDIKNQNEGKYIQEQYFLKAKKQAKEMKGFYIHLFITLFSSAIIIFINLQFVPGFHFFWFAIGGMFIAVFLHWLGVFGFGFLSLGKKWEERKMKELIKNYQ